MDDKQGSKGSSNRRPKLYSPPFNRMLVNRAILRPNGSIRLFWGGCDCGTPRAAEKLKKYTAAERGALRYTGLTGKIKDGIPSIRAVLRPWRYHCEQGHIHHQDFASFICPFGPAPGCVLTHGWGPDDPGFRVPHCRGPLRPEGLYRLVVEDPGLPRRMMGDTWGCPGFKTHHDHHSPLGRWTDARGNDAMPAP